jgi:hypothetical protein
LFYRSADATAFLAGVKLSFGLFCFLLLANREVSINAATAEITTVTAVNSKRNFIISIFWFFLRFARLTLRVRASESLTGSVFSCPLSIPDVQALNEPTLQNAQRTHHHRCFRNLPTLTRDLDKSSAPRWQQSRWIRTQQRCASRGRGPSRPTRETLCRPVVLPLILNRASLTFAPYSKHSRTQEWCDAKFGARPLFFVGFSSS